MRRILLGIGLILVAGIGVVFSLRSDAGEPPPQEAPLLLSEESAEETSTSWIEIPLSVPSPSQRSDQSPQTPSSPTSLPSSGDANRNESGGESAPTSRKEEKTATETIEYIYLDPSTPTSSSPRHTVELNSLVFPPHFLVSTPSYQIRPTVEIEGPYYIFTIDTPHGPYRVRSISALIKTCHEIEVMEAYYRSFHGPQIVHGVAKAVGQTARGAVEMVLRPHRAIQAIGRFPFRVIRDIGVSARMAARSDPEAKVRTAHAKGFLYSSEIRKVAWELGVDVYTDNERLTRLLHAIARPRKIGRLATEAFSPNLLPIKLARKAVTPGSLDVNTERAILENSAMELRRINAVLYERNFDLDYETCEPLSSLLYNPYYSPREQTVIRSCLTRIGVREGIVELLASLATCRSITVAIERTQEIVYLWSAHRNGYPIRRYVPFSHHTGVITESGTFLVILPWDLAERTPALETLFAEITARARSESANSILVWFAYEVAPDVIAWASEQGITVKGRGRLDSTFREVGFFDWPTDENKREASELIVSSKHSKKNLSEGSTPSSSVPMEEVPDRLEDSSEFRGNEGREALGHKRVLPAESGPPVLLESNPSSAEE